MQTRDYSGLQITGASTGAADAFRRAIDAFHGFRAEAAILIDEAIDDSPAFVMAHVAKANMYAVGANAAAAQIARDALAQAAALPMNDREAGHVTALRLLMGGELRAAGRLLEDISIAHPRDALALQAGQLVDFLTGDTRMLRDRVTRVMPAWSPHQPDYHGLLGMLAFGLEETGDYERAEIAGRQAVALEPRNGWAQHAVAHVMEMQDRRAEGLAWMLANIDAWSQNNTLAVHNWWHLALFHLGLGEVEAVLQLFDARIYGGPSGMEFDMVDASALLWRLVLKGVDVGSRWRNLADSWAPSAATGSSAFNDVHAMMAFVGDRRLAEAEALLDAQARSLHGPGDNALFLREVGAPFARAIHAFGDGRYAECVSLLRPVRSASARIGGSHAQRDVLDLTLIAAADRAGQTGLARALNVERQAAQLRGVGDRVFDHAA